MSGDGELILNLLLDRYERSRHYQAPGESPRGVFIRYDPQTLPDYWDEQRGERRAELNVASGHLAARGLVVIRRSRYSREEIERVDLNLERVAEAYLAAGRVSRREQEAALAKVAAEWAERWPDWRAGFARAVVDAVASGNRLPVGTRFGGAGLLAELCRVLDQLGPNGLSVEVPRRIFSQRVLGSSKRLEEIQAAVIGVLREFWPEPLPEDDREALAEVGILANPQHVFVAGPVVLDGVNVGAIGADVGLPAVFVDRCRVSSLAADQVITVENLTSFHQVVGRLPRRTVAVYLGGYHNRIRRAFLLKLAAAAKIRFRHWGDIDLGGFRIFAHLRRQTGLSMEPMLMDVDTYRQYAAGGMSFPNAYARELTKLLTREEYAQFIPLITEMLDLRRRVEQEAVDFC